MAVSTATDNRQLVTATEARKILGGMCRGAFYARQALGHLKPIRMGGRFVRYDVADLEAYIESCKAR